MNRNWTGILQGTLFFAYIPWKKCCSHTFRVSSKEVTVMHSEKLKAKYMKEDVWKSFFHKLAGWLSQLHYELTSSQIIFSDFSKWTPSNGYFSILYKMLEKHLCNSFLLHQLVKILQLVHEKSSFSEVLYERSVLKNFSKSTDTHKKQSSRGVLSNTDASLFWRISVKDCF